MPTSTGLPIYVEDSIVVAVVAYLSYVVLMSGMMYAVSLQDRIDDDHSLTENPEDDLLVLFSKEQLPLRLDQSHQEKLNHINFAEEIPSELCDPFTSSIMTHPAVLVTDDAHCHTGLSFDASTAKIYTVCAVSKKHLPVPNINLQYEAERWVDQQIQKDDDYAKYIIKGCQTVFITTAFLSQAAPSNQTNRRKSFC